MGWLVFARCATLSHAGLPSNWVWPYYLPHQLDESSHVRGSASVSSSTKVCRLDHEVWRKYDRGRRFSGVSNFIVRTIPCSSAVCGQTFLHGPPESRGAYSFETNHLALDLYNF